MQGLEIFFVNTFNGNPLLATFLISMLPIIELRGAIPFGTSEKLWGARALTLWQSYAVSLIGNLIVAAVIIALLIPVFAFMKKFRFFLKFINFFEDKFKKNAKELANKNRNTKKLLGIFIFVAIPLPLSGVWTGSAIAVFLGLPYLKSLFAVGAGAAASGLIMLSVTLIFGAAALNVFYFFLFAFVVLLTFFFAAALFKKSSESPGEIRKS